MDNSGLEASLRLVMSDNQNAVVPTEFMRAARTLALEIKRRQAEDLNPVMPFTGRDEVLLVTSRGAAYLLTGDTPPAFDTMTDRDIAVGRSLMALAVERMDRLESQK